MLLRRTGMQLKFHVTARAGARTTWDFFRNFGCALALARRLGSRWRPIESRGTLSLPVASALCLTALSALRTGPILPRCPPATPPAGGLSALGATVPRLRPRRLEPTFTSLQQTPARAIRPMLVIVASLTGIGSLPKLEEIHGSRLLPTDPASGGR